jgi:heme/copper-type cytochrome/quinol oxidase subunit 4
MERNLARGCLVIVTLGAEAFLLLVSAVSGFAAADSGRQELHWFALGVFVQMLVLLVGGLACTVGSPGLLRIATVLGVVLLVLGLALIVVSSAAFAHDVNRGTFVFGLILPAVVVLGGVWLMRQTGHKVDASPPGG